MTFVLVQFCFPHLIVQCIYRPADWWSKKLYVSLSKLRKPRSLKKLDKSTPKQFDCGARAPPRGDDAHYTACASYGWLIPACGDCNRSSKIRSGPRWAEMPGTVDLGHQTLFHWSITFGWLYSNRSIIQHTTVGGNAPRYHLIHGCGVSSCVSIYQDLHN